MFEVLSSDLYDHDDHLKRRFYKLCFNYAVRSRCFRLPDNFIVLLFQKLHVEMQFRLRLSKEIQTSILQN